jgi:hypothetical protein
MPSTSRTRFTVVLGTGWATGRLQFGLVVAVAVGSLAIGYRVRLGFAPTTLKSPWANGTEA